MKLVTIENKTLKLNSLMDELSFGKTNYDSIVTEKGLFASGKFNLTTQIFTELNFSGWTFSGIQALDVEYQEQRSVFFCGEVPFFSEKVSSLSDLYSKDKTKEEKSRLFDTVTLLIALFTQTAQTDIQIPQNGAGGIFVEAEEKSGIMIFSILFLPPDLYRYSAITLPQDQSAQIYGFWKNETLYDLPSLCFMRSVLAYRLLTGAFPFTKTDITERNSDILDKNFLPTAYAVKEINGELAKEIDKSLRLTSSAVNIPGKKQKGKSNEDLFPDKNFPLNLFYAEKENYLLSSPADKSFTERAEAYTKIQNSKIAAKRKVRKNSATIIVVAIICAIVGIITVNTVRGKLNEYTTIGLTSEQTIQAYFKTYNSQDLGTIGNLVKGKSANEQVDTLSRIYVVSKQRTVYSRDHGIVAPETWFFYVTDYTLDSSSGMFGITNLYIDGKPFDFNISMALKKERPAPLTEEKGISLSDGEKSVHSVEYYLIHSEGENNEIFVEYIDSTFTLTYKKDRWIITDIQTDSVNIDMNSRLFKNEYFNMLRQNNKDVISTLQKLSIRYPWLPPKNVLEQEKKRVEYKLAHPFESVR